VACEQEEADCFQVVFDLILNLKCEKLWLNAPMMIRSIEDDDDRSARVEQAACLINWPHVSAFSWKSSLEFYWLFLCVVWFYNYLILNLTLTLNLIITSSLESYPVNFFATMFFVLSLVCNLVPVWTIKIWFIKRIRLLVSLLNCSVNDKMNGQKTINEC
jgi:hypothetical protein